MKNLGMVSFPSAVLAFDSLAAKPQNLTDASTKNEVHISTTLPSGQPVRLSALSVDRNWVTFVTHLRGNVQVEMRETVQGGTLYFVVRADEADFNEKTGELTPRGNVRITHEERH